MSFYKLFPQNATLPVYLFIYLFLYFQRTFLFYLTSFYGWIYIFSRSFGLNFARTLGRAVDKLLNIWFKG